MLTAFLTGCHPEAAPQAKGGILDLRNQPGALDRPLALSGEWLFYWNRFIEPTETLPADATITVPGSWAGLPVDGTMIPVEGFASYRLRILLPEAGMHLGLAIPEVNSACRILVDGSVVATRGTVGSDAASTRPKPGTDAIWFTAADTSLDLLVHIANFSDDKAGFWYPPHLGTGTVIRSFRERSIMLEVTIFGCLAILGLYHLAFFFYRRKERPLLHFGCFALVIGCRMLVSDNIVLAVLFPDLGWETAITLAFLTIYASLPTFLAFIFHLFPGCMHRLVPRAATVTAAAFSLLALAWPAKSWLPGFVLFQPILLTGCAVVVLALARAVRRRLDGGRAILTGFLLFFLFVISDLLHYNGYHDLGFFVPHGLLIFTVFLAVVLARRFSRIAAVAELTSQDLEREVRERTAALEKERAGLRLANNLLLRDMELAREIQRRFIPSASPFPEIAFYYKPMQMVGGDFLDFISFSPTRVGIFLSDVSGHGVPAAFVTSLLKGFIMQFSRRIENPAGFLVFLNGLLGELSAGNFVTAFYGIFDFTTRELVFSSAGHCVPYRIKDGTTVPLFDSPAGIPLAVLDNDEMALRGLVYQDRHVTLDPGERLFLYTDGIAEASRGGRGGDAFEDRELRRSLGELAGASNWDLMLGLVERLRVFHGSDDFEDDVCLISLDVPRAG